VDAWHKAGHDDSHYQRGSYFSTGAVGLSDA
jgi:hypothetical protein